MKSIEKTLLIISIVLFLIAVTTGVINFIFLGYLTPLNIMALIATSLSLIVNIIF